MLDLMGRPVEKDVYENFTVDNGVCIINAPSWDELMQLMKRLPYDLSNTPLAEVKEFWWNGRLYGTVY